MTKKAKRTQDVVDGKYAEIPDAAGSLPEPTEHRKAAIAQSQERMAQRRPRVSVTLPEGASGGTLAIQSPHADQNGWAAQLNDALGTSSADFSGKMLTTLANVAAAKGQHITQSELNAGLAFLDGIEPQNELEASLAVGMYGANDLAADLLRRARCTDRVDFLAAYVNAATKLQRTAVAQAEALAKLKRGGEQVVKVVYVDQRTQTVIGEQTNHLGSAGASVREGVAINAALAYDPAQVIDVGKTPSDNRTAEVVHSKDSLRMPL